MQPPDGCKWGYFRRIFAILGKIDEKQGKNTKKGVQINAPPIKKEKDKPRQRNYITALKVNPLVAFEQTLHLPMILAADRVGTISITSESVFFLQAIHRIKTVLSFTFRNMKFKILENIYPSPFGFSL